MCVQRATNLQGDRLRLFGLAADLVTRSHAKAAEGRRTPRRSAQTGPLTSAPAFWSAPSPLALFLSRVLQHPISRQPHPVVISRILKANEYHAAAGGSWG